MPVLSRVHRAWWVALATFLVLLAAAAFRSSFGVMLNPIEDEFGWSQTATSLAVSVSLVVYGVTAPFAAALMERFGVRRIAAIALVLIGVGTGLTTVMTAAWELVVLWGLFVGLGTGATALVFGALEPKSGALVSVQRAHESPGLNHTFDVVPGVLEDECREMIRQFFRDRRRGR